VSQQERTQYTLDANLPGDVGHGLEEGVGEGECYHRKGGEPVNCLDTGFAKLTPRAPA